MISEDKSISRSAIWQLAGKFALQGVAFFTTPFFTRLLTPEDYGYTALYTSWLSIISIVIGLQTYGSIANARIEDKIKNLDEYVSSIMTVSLISFVCILTVFAVFNSFFSSIFSIRRDLVILLVVQSFCAYVINFYTTKLDVLKEAKKSACLSFFQALISVLLALVFVTIYKSNKAIVKIYGQAIPIIIIGIVLLLLIYVKGKTFWQKEYINFCFALTLPLVLHAVGGVIFGQTDRIMLQKIIGENELGVYSVTFSLCSVLTIIYSALNSAWGPFYFDYKKNNDITSITEHTKNYLNLFTTLTIGFLFLSPDVFKLMAPEPYWNGIKLIPLFVTAEYFGFLYLFPINFELFCKKTTMMPVGTLLAALLNVIVNFILIPKYGIKGAAIGTILAYFSRYIFHELIARFIIKEKYDYNYYIFIPRLILVLFCSALLYFFDIMNILRWLIFFVLSVYTVFRIIKNKSIF